MLIGNDSTIFYAWLALIAKLGLPLFLLPLSLIYLDNVDLSLWLVFLTINSMGLLADSGFSQSIIRTTAQFQAGVSRPGPLNESDEGEHSREDLIAGIFLASSRLYTLVSVISVLIIFFVGGAASLNLMNMSESSSYHWLAFLFLTVSGGFQVYLGRYASLASGLGKVAEIKRAETLSSVVRLMLSVFAFSLPLVLLGLMIANFLGVLFQMYLFRKVLQESYSFTGKPSNDLVYSIVKKIWPSTWRLGLVFWGGFLIYHGSALIAAQLDSAIVISQYLVALRVVMLLRSLAFAPITARIPRFAEMTAKEDFPAMREQTSQLIALSFLVYVSGSIFLLLAGEQVLSVFGFSLSALSGHLLLLILVVYFLELHHSIHATIYVSTNKVPFVLPTVLSGVTIFIGGYGVLIFGNSELIALVYIQFLVQLVCNNWFPVYLSLKLQEFPFHIYLSEISKSILKMKFIRQFRF